MATTILDTTSSETGTVVEFGQINKYEPETAVIQIQLSSGDTVAILGKVGELDYDVIESFTESGFKTFYGLPDSIRVDRTVDGGVGEAYAAIT
jgi:hypothetical protein